MTRVIEVGDGDDLPFNLVAAKADVNFPYPGEPIVSGAELQLCRIHAKKLTNVDWRRSVLDRCSFTGHYIDNNFGTETVVYADGRVATGALRACDFTEARLHACGFFNVDLGECRFAPWPTFLVMNPRVNGKVLAKKPWEGKLGVWVVVLQSQSADCDALVFDAVEMSKREKVKLESLRRALKRFEGIVVTS